MLIKFTVENYKNFRNPITLDFTETHDYKFNPKCVNNNLLSKIVIYGPNASGKSNLGLAIFDIVRVLTDKHQEKNQSDELSFINADSNSSVAKFDYSFKRNQDIIRYSYCKTSPTRLIYEELYINDVHVFSYDYIGKIGRFSRLDLIEAQSLNFEYFDNDLAILRYVANNTTQSEDSFVRFIMNFVSHMLWFRSVQGNSFIGLISRIELLNDWIIENDLVGEFQKFLQEMAGVNMNLDVVTETSTSKKVLVDVHKNKSLVFEQTASSGTASLQLLFYWSRRFKDVSFLYMDEFDAFYHYELARNVLRYIYELDNIQAVLTTHNSYLASNELLRPDCYFVLSDGQIKSFVDSTDRELREGHNLEKMLRNGEFDV